MVLVNIIFVSVALDPSNRFIMPENVQIGKSPCEVCYF